jgi:hypothetical protein
MEIAECPYGRFSSRFEQLGYKTSISKTFRSGEGDRKENDCCQKEKRETCF